MLTMRALLLIVALLTFASGISAQSSQPCAQISIESPTKVDPGTPIVFSSRVTNISSTETLTYRWQVSAGTITSGQGSSEIAVDTTGLGGQSVEATVEFNTRVGTCSVKSKVVEIAAPPIACGMAFDEYGDIRWNDEMARLDNFAIQMMNIPSARGTIITLAGNPTYRGEAAFRLDRAANYLVNVRGISRERLIITDAGYRTQLTTYLWIVPEGLNPPVLESEIPLSEVRFTKPKPSVSRKSTRHRSN